MSEETLPIEDVIEEEPVAEQVEEEEVVEETEEGSEEEASAEVIEEDEHKTTANERIRELIDRSKKAEAELNDLKSKFEAEQKHKELAQRPFLEIDMDRLETDIAKMYDQVDELRLEGKPLEAAKVQKKIIDLQTAIDENEKAKQKWVAEQETRNTQEKQVQTRLKEIEDAASFYQRSMSIPQDVWDAGGSWFRTQLDTNPVLGQKFAQYVDRQGAVAGIEWAHQYIIENMGKRAEEAKEKKEEAKKKNVGGTSTSNVAANAPKSFTELMKLSGKEIAALEKDNPKLFNKLINDKINRR